MDMKRLKQIEDLKMELKEEKAKVDSFEVRDILERIRVNGEFEEEIEKYFRENGFETKRIKNNDGGMLLATYGTLRIQVNYKNLSEITVEVGRQKRKIEIVIHPKAPYIRRDVKVTDDFEIKDLEHQILKMKKEAETLAVANAVFRVDGRIMYDAREVIQYIFSEN